MSRRIKRVPAYHASVAALPRTRAVRTVLDALIARVMARPEEPAVLDGTNARCVHHARTAIHPALSLFYSIDETTIYLLHLEAPDELLDDE